MPVFRLNAYFGVARDVKVFLNLEAGVTRGAAPNAANPKNNGRGLAPEYARLAEEIEVKRRELREIRRVERAEREGGGQEARTARRRRAEYTTRKKRAKLEIFRLESELKAAEEGRAGEPVTGALPDFLVIGVGKGGTTFLYHLLTQHPLVEPAATKELHFFDNKFDLGPEWYRQNFPAPNLKDGRTTITGEATPYIADPHVPERAAQVAPEARLIALLRNPVDRAYSRYHQLARRGWMTKTFEEAVEEEIAQLEEARLSGPSRSSDVAEIVEAPPGYQGLYKGLYADHLRRWSEFFDDEQMLILKSEDFFKSPQQVLQQVFGFLGLPEWEPDPSEFERKRNSRSYEKMSPETRRRLEEFFAPHNERLYDYLGRDLGW